MFSERTKGIILLLAAGLLASGCSRSPQAREARYIEEGQRQFEKKDYTRAILLFRNAVQVMPKDPEPYYRLGLAYLAASDVRMAVASFRRTTELNPRHAGAQLKLAELMSLSRSKELIEEAERRAQGVLESQPNDADALSLLAYTELRLGRPEDAEAHLEQALRHSPNHLKASVALARTRLARRDPAGAEAVLKQAAVQAPRSPDPANYLGEFYLVMGRGAEAEKQFRAALQADPKYAPALLNLAALQVRDGKDGDAEQTFKVLSALPGKRYRSIHAVFLFQTGKTGEAVAELERLWKEDPNDLDTRTRLVSAYLTLKREKEAEAVLAGALKKHPRDVDALLQRARIHLNGSRYAEAQNDLNQVLGIRKESAEAHYLLAKVYDARGESSSAQRHLAEALQLDPAYGAARIDLARTLIAGKGAGSALKLLDEAPQQQKQSLPVVIQRNWALMAGGNKEEARRGIDRALASSRVSDALLQDAVLKIDGKDYSGARASAEEILRKDPADTRALRVLYDSYAALKQETAGLSKVREYAAKQPNAAAVQQFLGGKLMAAGDAEGARKAFEAARAAKPGWAPAELALAQMDILEGKRDAARQRLSHAVSANPANLPGRLMWADLEVRDGKAAAGIEQYRAVLDRDSRNLTALNNLACLLADSGQQDEALKYAQLAKEIAPDNAAVDDTLGWTYYRKGMYTSALRHLESAAAREATPVRKYHLGMACMKAGDPKRGREILEAALRAAPNLPEAEAAGRLLRGQ